VPNFKLKFPESDIRFWTDRYPKDTDMVPNSVGKFARDKGYLNVKNLYAMCNWKSSRRAKVVQDGNPATIREITKFAFSTSDQRSKISALTLLPGVMSPTATVILHFCAKKPYPILDFRAIWSLGEERPYSYDFEHWWEYAETCRELAKRNGVSIRNLDKALWQYSKENGVVGN